MGLLSGALCYRSAVRALRTPLGATAMVLAVAAVLDPVGNVNSLTKPDQRLLFPAILIVLAVLPWKPVCPVAAFACVGIVAAALAQHAVALVSVDGPL